MNLLRWVVFVLVLASVRVFAGEPATAVATVTAGFVSGITVTSGGSGYTSEPVVTITGGGGTGATAKAILSGDRVAVVLVLTAGNGYTSAPGVAIEAPPSVLTAKCFTLSTPHAILRGCRELRRLFPWPLSKPINSVVRCGQAARRPRR